MAFGVAAGSIAGVLRLAFNRHHVINIRTQVCVANRGYNLRNIPISQVTQPGVRFRGNLCNGLISPTMEQTGGVRCLID